jgi:predicted transcriptional regulator
MKNLKKYISERNISPRDFASEVDISISYLYHIINGVRRPSPETALKIEKATGGEVKAVDLIFGRSPDAA